MPSQIHYITIGVKTGSQAKFTTVVHQGDARQA